MNDDMAVYPSSLLWRIFPLPLNRPLPFPLLPPLPLDLYPFPFFLSHTSFQFPFPHLFSPFPSFFLSLFFSEIQLGGRGSAVSCFSR